MDKNVSSFLPPAKNTSSGRDCTSNRLAICPITFWLHKEINPENTIMNDPSAYPLSAKTYGIDSDNIGAIGLSAGGHLTALLATSAGVVELEGDGGNMGV